MNQHISLESLFVSERTEEVYAKLIAEEDMEDSYGKEIILPERKPIPREDIF